MKSLSRLYISVILVFACCLGLCGCTQANTSTLEKAFSYQNENAGDTLLPVSYSQGLASELAVVDKNTANSPNAEQLHSQSAMLVRVSTKEVLFHKNVHLRMYPASTTKIMTALLALENGDTSSYREVGEEVNIEGENIVLCDYRVGDQISFDTALHGALLRSGNDAAAFLATFANPDQAAFVQMMNERAMQIGATNTHFTNVHGLHDANHYTSAYDLYLIFNTAIQNPTFRKTIHDKTYFGTFTRTTEINTYTINAEYETNNQYLNGTHPIPYGISIVGGKSGFTYEATANYICLFRANNEDYIVVVMGAPDKNMIYEDMDTLMKLIPIDTSILPDSQDETTFETKEDESEYETGDYTPEVPVNNGYSDHE